MIINSNAKFNTSNAEVSAIGLGGIAAPFCACCMCRHRRQLRVLY